MIVVCVDAIAEVTIARTTSLSHGEPSTSRRESAEDPLVVVVLGEQLEPRVRDHGRRDEHVRDDEDDRAHAPRRAREPGCCRVSPR